jgi:hypothetical protein
MSPSRPCIVTLSASPLLPSALAGCAVLARSQRVAAITGMLREAEPTGKEAPLRQCRERDTRAALAQTGEARGRVRCAATMRRGSAAVCRRERRSGSLRDYCDKVAKARRLRGSRGDRAAFGVQRREYARCTLYPIPTTCKRSDPLRLEEIAQLPHALVRRGRHRIARLGGYALLQSGGPGQRIVWCGACTDQPQSARAFL